MLRAIFVAAALAAPGITMAADVIGTIATQAELVADLRAHPEWDPILFPEKYRPNEPPLAASEQALAAVR